MIATSPIELTGFLAVPDIAGESRVVGHEDEIDVHRIAWQVEERGGTVGRGRRRARAEVGPVVVDSWYDAASPYLALAAMQGKAFDEVVLSVRRDPSDRLDHLVIEMRSAVIAGYRLLNDYEGAEETIRRIPQRIELAFEEITIRYVEQSSSGAAGTEHEIVYDVAAGA